MARVRTEDTAPEMAVRRALHARGLRYRLHRADLPGRPDVVLPRHRTALFVHGCYWHGCERCDRGRRRPKTNATFWAEKTLKNRERDERHVRALEAAGWRVAVVWECDARSPERLAAALDRIFTDMRQPDVMNEVATALTEQAAEAARGEPWSVADFFSCGGGTSCGFTRREGFKVVGAVDLELAKPSGGIGSSDCNTTYQANHGVAPLNRDMMELAPTEFMRHAGLKRGGLKVMISCAPCTELSRAKPTNHLEDSPKNSLIGRSGEFAAGLWPELFFMENARELIQGNFAHHHEALVRRLTAEGYDVRSDVHYLSQFGLPQVRERALVVASRIGPARTLEDLWDGWAVRPAAVTVRTALARLAEWKADHPDDPDGDAFPGMRDEVLTRLKATPHDGGGWVDLARNEATRHLLTPDCLRRWEIRDLGSHPDVYGRMAWDRPAPTIKRECAHVGNGRYAHPVEDRLLTVREMAVLNGFPFDYKFPAKAVANRYRHVGDAVPPVIAYQMSAVAMWMLTGVRPKPKDWVLPNSALRVEDIVPVKAAAADQPMQMAAE